MLRKMNPPPHFFPQNSVMDFRREESTFIYLEPGVNSSFNILSILRKQILVSLEFEVQDGSFHSGI